MSRARGMIYCTVPCLPVQRTAIWPVFRVTEVFFHLVTKMLGILPTEGTSEEKSLTKPNLPCLFSKNESTALQILDLLITVFPSLVKLN